MTFTNVTAIIDPTVTSKQFTLVPGGVGHFILMGIISPSTSATWATALSSAGGNVTWTSVGTPAHLASGVNTATVALFIGQVVTASSHVVTVTTNTGSPTLRALGSEFSNTLGFSAVTVDASGTEDVSASGHFPAVTPTRSGDLYWSPCYDFGSGSTGTTSGYTYNVDPNGNVICFNTSCANSTQTPNIGNTDGITGIGIMLYEAGTSAAGSITIAGTAAAAAPAAAAGALDVTGTVTVPVPPPPPVPVVLVLPQVIVEAGLVTASPVQPSTVLVLDDPVLGLLDTATLGGGISWSSISPKVISFSVTRPSTRLAGPLWNYQPGTASILLDNSDGSFDPDNLAGPYVISGATELLPMVPVRIRAVFAGVTYALYSGYADGWMPAQVTYAGGYAELTLPATDAFKVLAGITLPALGSPAGIGATTGARIRDILTRAGWWTSAEYSAVGPGSSTLQGTSLGDTALNLMQIAADSEIGQLYVNGSGAVTFRGRQQILSEARSNTVQAVFGDLPGTSHPAGTELACAAIGRASDDTTIANDIQATHTGGTLQEVRDAASVAKYLFPRSYARSDLILQGDNDALAWAQWVLYVSKGGEDRFESLQVDPAADPANLWPQVLGRETGDRIQVWSRPAQAGLPYSSGSASSPAAFANILFTTAAPGTYTVTWTVTLAGTLSAADVNNFGLYNGTTFVAGSINPAAPGVYPQAPVTFTVTGGAPDVKVLSAGNAATAGSVYGAAVPSPVAKDCFIAGITHAWDSVTSAWLTTWTLQDTVKYGNFMTLDNPTTGQLDANALAF